MKRFLHCLDDQLDFFWLAFVTSFCLRIPLLGMLLFVLALVGGFIGAGFGVVDLVFHDEPIKQFFVGASLGVLVMGTLLIGFLLWRADVVERDARAKRLGTPWGGQAVGWSRWYRNVGIGRVRTPLGAQQAPTTSPGWSKWLRVDGIGLCVLGTALALLPRSEWLSGFLDWSSLVCLFVGSALLLGVRGWFPPQGRAAAGRQPGNWSFFGYACGIVVLLSVIIALVCLTVLLAWAFMGILGRDRLSWLTLSWRSLPLLAGVICSVLMVWGVLAVGLTEPLSGWLHKLWQNLRAIGGPAIRQPADTEFHIFVTVLVFLGVLVYLFVVAPLASGLGDFRGPFVVGFCVFLVVLWGACKVWPEGWGKLMGAIDRHTHMPNEQDYGYNAAASVLLVLLSFFFFVVESVSGFSSPLTTLCMVLYLMLALYGVIAYTIRRILPILVAGLLLILVFSGIPPLRCRFEGLPGDESTYDKKHGTLTIETERDGGLTNLKELDLVAHAKRDSKYLKEFDEARTSRKTQEEVDKIKSELRKNRLRPLNNPQVKDEKDEADLLFPDDLEVVRGSPAIPSGNKEPLVLVTVSGGGLRSAVWTLRVLQQLERDFADNGIDFPARVRLICGASGGMLGAAYYVATLPDPQTRAKTIAARMANRNEEPQRWKDLDDYSRRLQVDFLTPLIKKRRGTISPRSFRPGETCMTGARNLRKPGRNNSARRPRCSETKMHST